MNVRTVSLSIFLWRSTLRIPSTNLSLSASSRKVLHLHVDSNALGVTDFADEWETDPHKRSLVGKN